MPAAPKASSMRARGSKTTIISCGWTARNAAASFWRWSTLTATISTPRGRYSRDNASRAGNDIRQSGHQLAHKSTSTIFPLNSASRSDRPRASRMLDIERVEGSGAHPAVAIRVEYRQRGDRREPRGDMIRFGFVQLFWSRASAPDLSLAHEMLDKRHSAALIREPCAKASGSIPLLAGSGVTVSSVTSRARHSIC